MTRTVSLGPWQAGCLCLLLSAVAGCTFTPVDPGAAPDNPPPSDATPVEPTAAAESVRGVQSVAERAEPRILRGPSIVSGEPLAVVLSDRHNSQLEMLQVFSARLERPYRIFNLAARTSVEVRAALAELAPIQVIAIGPAAYEATATVAGLDVYYAGVLNPGSTTQGIDALPPFGAQLDYWLALTPEIKRLGVVAGPDLSWRVDALAAACRERGVTLEQRQVRSDKETQLAFRSMVPHIDGFVFLPDDEVLSPAVIQQVMSHGNRNGVEILVYSPVMFNLGASLFLQPDPVEVALSLIELIDDPKQPPVVKEMRTRVKARGNTLALAPSGVELKLARLEADDG